MHCLFPPDIFECRSDPAGESTDRLFLIVFSQPLKFPADGVRTVCLPQWQTLPFSSRTRFHLSVQQQHLLVELKRLISPHTRIAFCSCPSASQFRLVSLVISPELLQMVHRAPASDASKGSLPPSLLIYCTARRGECGWRDSGKITFSGKTGS